MIIIQNEDKLRVYVVGQVVFQRQLGVFEIRQCSTSFKYGIKRLS